MSNHKKKISLVLALALIAAASFGIIGCGTPGDEPVPEEPQEPENGLEEPGNEEDELDEPEKNLDDELEDLEDELEEEFNEEINEGDEKELELD